MNPSYSSPPVPPPTKKPLALLFAALLTTSSAQTTLAAVHPATAFYDNANYTYCDIKLLSAYWKQSRYDSKVRAGEKILRNEYDVLESYLNSARTQAEAQNLKCTFADADNPAYTYQDAEVLANFWGKPTPYEAKLKVAAMLQDGDNKLVKRALTQARQSGGTNNRSHEIAAANAFYDNPTNTYCDLRLLSAYWQQDFYESKIRAGSKLLAGAHSTMEQYRQAARDYALEHNVRCTFADADNPRYTYEDAVKLANYWGKPEPYGAKLKIAGMLQAGQNKLVKQALQNGKNGS